MISDVMSVLNIFIISAKEFGRVQGLFYNATKVLLSVGMEEYQKLANRRLTLVDFCTDEEVIRTKTTLFSTKKALRIWISGIPLRAKGH